MLSAVFYGGPFLGGPAWVFVKEPRDHLRLVGSFVRSDHLHVYCRRPDHAASRRIPPFPRRHGRRTEQGHHRSARGHRVDPGVDLHARSHSAGRGSRPGQDLDGQLDRPDSRRGFQADPVHARPDALGHHRHQRSGRAGSGPAGLPVRAGADLRQHHSCRRDQPDAAQDPGGAACRRCRSAK